MIIKAHEVETSDIITLAMEMLQNMFTISKEILMYVCAFLHTALMVCGYENEYYYVFAGNTM